MSKAQRVALVTGGAKRVGRAIVERLAAANFTVAFTYHSSETQAKQLAKSVGGFAIQADFVDPVIATQDVFKSFTDRFTELHALVNNASIYQPGKLAVAQVDQFRRMMSVHVETPMLLCQKFEKHLRRSRGHVINMIDLLAERPWPEYLAYCASKAALANLTLSLARELAPQVTVNGISPGVIEWPPNYPISQQRNYLKRVPLNRAGGAKEAADLVHFLTTEGSYITGQIIRLDGGRSIT
jgi:pteridine reductase